MEKTFLRMKKSPEARDAYVQAEVVTALAMQIRAIRMQRHWSQAELAKKMGTTQAAVSRLEDPSYGRLSIKTLLELSRVFDTGLRVQFVSTITMLHETFKPKAHLREVPSFEQEALNVGFYSCVRPMTESAGIQPHSVVSVPIEHAPPPQKTAVVFIKMQMHAPASPYRSELVPSTP